MVRLNRAVALLEGGEPAAALDEVDRLGATLDGYHPWHATRAEVLAHLGRTDEAVVGFRRAIEHCDNVAVVAHLRRRVAELSPPTP